MPVSRVASHHLDIYSEGAIDRRIRREIEINVHYYALHPQEIERRLRELDREWALERVLEASCATLALGGSLLAMVRSRAFLLIPVAVTAFLLQHALQGWSPPVPFFRRQGVRTAAEIESERAALKALRGDFASVERMPNAPERANAAFQSALV